MIFTRKEYNGVSYASIKHMDKYKPGIVNEIQVFENSFGSWVCVATDGYIWGKYREFTSKIGALACLELMLIELGEKNDFSL